MKRGDVLFWLVLDSLTLEPLLRTGTREEARELTKDESSWKHDGLVASVRIER